MYREIHRQIKIYLAQYEHYTSNVVAENEQLRNEIVRLRAEIETLKHNAEKLTETSSEQSTGND